MFQKGLFINEPKANLVARRQIMEAPPNMVISFIPFTSNLAWSSNKNFYTSTNFLYNHTYQAVIDATVEENTRAIIFLGGTGGNNNIWCPFDQNGTVVVSGKITRNVTYNNKIYIYCRPSSNDGNSHLITVRSLRIEDITSSKRPIAAS